MNNIIEKLKKKLNINFLIRILILLIGVVFVGFGIVFNLVGMFGNDVVVIIYDGIRNVFGF